jgi:hypothetical protein
MPRNRSDWAEPIVEIALAFVMKDEALLPGGGY